MGAEKYHMHNGLVGLEIQGRLPKMKEHQNCILNHKREIS